MADKKISEQDIRALLYEIDTLLDPEAYQFKVADDIGKQVDRYREEDFNEAQLDEIERGMKDALPVEHYAKTEYNWKQMREIRMGMMEEVDVSVYSNPLYTAAQMLEIRRGQRYNLDVLSYARLIYALSDMRRARRKLLVEAYKKSPRGFEKKFMIEEDGVWLHISDNMMKAYLVIEKGCKRSYTSPELLTLLKQHDIVYGFQEKNLEQLARDNLRGQEILVAEGDNTDVGHMGWYELFFNRNLPGIPIILPDGKADYNSVIVAEMVEQGQKLATYHPAENGRVGMTVTGLEVPGMKGQDLPPLAGRGFIKSEDGKSYFAGSNGHVSYEEMARVLNVWNVLVIPKNLTRIHKDISFDGTVHVRGNISGMISIKAGGNIVVDGFIEGANLEAGANVVIRGGVNADNQGMIKANGKIMGNFFESANLEARGSIEGNYFLNCMVRSGERVIAKGSKSRIIGGKIWAAIGVETVTLGNNSKSMTYVIVGDSDLIDMEYMQSVTKIGKIDAELKKLTEGKQVFLQQFDLEVAEANPIYQKIQAAILIREDEVKREVGNRDRIDRLRARAKNAFVIVKGQTYESAMITVCGVKKEVDRMLSHVTFTKDKRTSS